MHDVLQKTILGQRLSESEAYTAMGNIMAGEGVSSQINEILVAFQRESENVEEITGFARAMREVAIKVHTKSYPLVDICGTGGDGLHTFNISTAAAFIVAGAGVKVAKHGNRAASSQCGSADVLEELGVNIDLSPEHVARCIDEIGIGFLFARSFHPAMQYVASVRSELGVRTVFNILGPLLNPAGATRQVVGVFDQYLIKPIACVLNNLGAEHAFVVHGAGGLDEISTLGETKISEVHRGTIRYYAITPEEVGCRRATMNDLRGGTREQNASIVHECLSIVSGPRQEIAMLNAAAVIVVAGLAESMAGGFELAQQSCYTGAAQEKLEALTAFSHHT